MKVFFMLFVSVLMLGCSENKPAKVDDEASFSSMVDSQAKAMQKARDLEGALREAEKKRREDMAQ